MGIVESTLASFELSTFEDCQIERNSDGSVHLHMDGIRIELSHAEFEEFAAVIEQGRNELHAVKHDDDHHP